MLDIKCKKCGAGFRVPEKYAGKRIKCGKCSEPIRIPSVQSDSIEAPDMDMSLDFLKNDNAAFDALLKHEREAPPIEAIE